MAFTMFDSIRVGALPAGAGVVAGYVGGSWPTYANGALKAAFPKSHLVSVAVASQYDADVLDVEKGDATNEVAASWVKRQQAMGNHKPGVYTFISNVAPLLDALRQQGIRREDIWLWVADWTYKPHICTPACGHGMPTTADATQWTDRALGRSLDQSLLSSLPNQPVPAASVPPAVVPQGEAKNQSPFTRAVWPVPLPDWFWYWAAWKKGLLAEKPLGSPWLIPAWAWARLARL